MPDTKGCTDCGRVMHIDNAADRCPECRQNFPEQCLVRCCSTHPDRRCQLPPGHDGDHNSGDGYTWLPVGWERK
jgi:hypothetical protein